MARQDTGAVCGVHCNRKIGPTLEFGCKASEKVTVYRIGREADGAYRSFIATGEALDMPQQFLGTSLVVKTDANAEDMIYSAVEKGWEPHFVVIYGDHADELEILSHMLDIEVEKY